MQNFKKDVLVVKSIPEELKEMRKENSPKMMLEEEVKNLRHQVQLQE